MKKTNLEKLMFIVNRWGEFSRRPEADWKDEFEAVKKVLWDPAIFEEESVEDAQDLFELLMASLNNFLHMSPINANFFAGDNYAELLNFYSGLIDFTMELCEKIEE